MKSPLNWPNFGKIWPVWRGDFPTALGGCEAKAKKTSQWAHQIWFGLEVFYR